MPRSDASAPPLPLRREDAKRRRCRCRSLLHARAVPRPFRDGGNVVTQVKTAATDGYDSVQVGYHGVREDKLTRPELGHLGKAGAPPLRHLQEFRLVAVDAFDPGQELEFNELFKEGDLVDVSAKTIGKGFQGQ